MKIKLTLIVTIIAFVLTGRESFAQTDIHNNAELVKNISKSLSGQSKLEAIKGKKDIYAFNIRLDIENKNGLVSVSNIVCSDSVGYLVFPNYNQLKKIDYKELVAQSKKITLIIPVLILNNSKAGQNPDQNFLAISNNSVIDIMTSMLYPDILRKNIAVFPLFKLIRVDIQ